MARICPEEAGERGRRKTNYRLSSGEQRRVLSYRRGRPVMTCIVVGGKSLGGVQTCVKRGRGVREGIKGNLSERN